MPVTKTCLLSFIQFFGCELVLHVLQLHDEGVRRAVVHPKKANIETKRETWKGAPRTV